MNAARPSLGALTGLRFLAAFGVVLYHFDRTPLTHWLPIRNIESGGFAAVSLFFVLSGFILSYTYLGTDGALRGTRRNFWVSRFARIYPAYLLGFLLAAPADILISLRVNTFHAAVVKLAAGAVAVLTMQQAWTPWTAWAWNFPAWSVSVEAFFYLLFPWIGPRLARLRGRAAVRAAGVLWLLLILPPAILFAVKRPMGPPGTGDYLQMAVEFTPLFRLPEFALGILLGRAFTAGSLSWLRGRYLSILAALGVLAVLAFTPYLPHPLLAAGLLTPWFALLLATLAQDAGWFGRLLSTRLMVLLGEASYGIYILQIPVALALGFAPPLYIGRMLGVYCVALVTVALLSFRCLEAPLRVRIKDWLGERVDLERRRCAPSGASALTSTPGRDRGESSDRFTARRTVLIGGGAALAAAAIDGVANARDRRRSVPVPPWAITLVSTTQHDAFATRPLRMPGESWAALELEVFPDRPRQSVSGFGGCFNEMGWTALQALSPGDRQAILRELFAPGVGASLNLCRMPIGANDFAQGWYSLDETPGDFALEHFSIERDRQRLIPFIRAAQEQNPALRLWACPWSPPSWMKRSHSYGEPQPAPGEPSAGMTPDEEARSSRGNCFILEEPYLQAYANYFGRFIDAYRQQGIAVEMVMPQNEFNSPHPFPSCTWTAAGLARFLGHLGPVMAARGVQTFLGTFEAADPAIVAEVLRDPEVRRDLRGVGVQWAARTATADLHARYPELAVYQSEQECGDGRNSWRYAVYCWDQMREYFDSGANAYMYWNLALPEGGESHWGWRQNSLITVNPGAGSYQFRYEYLVLKHLSHFVQPGARVLKTRGFLADVLAFGNPDGSTVVALRNGLPVRRPVDVLIGRRRVEAWVEPDSFSTLLVRA